MMLRSWTRRRSLVAVFGVILALDLAAGIGSATLAAAASSVKQDAAPGTPEASSAETLDWNDGHRDPTDPNFDHFQNLKVTVGQTQNLTDQGVQVSWTGGTVTPPQDDKTDYMQIMQCWGDPTSGPTPQQCEWGEPSASLAALVGTNAASRQLANGEDPAQDYGPDYQVPLPFGEQAWAVKFKAVDGTSSWDPSTYFSPANSNEVTVARTGQDGSGSYVFQTQTSLSAPSLGCGAPIKSGTTVTGRSCWLVVVPRGELNPDGSDASTNSDNRVSGSPLSASVWADRIQFKLGFTAIGASCPLGRAEQRTAGTELIADAFTSWQTALCATGTTYGYSEIGDSEARTEVLSGVQGAAGLGFVSDPISPLAANGSTLEYAPVAASGIVVAYNIDKDLEKSAPDFADNGNPITDLQLTPRLVAKLLTQSYQDDVPGGNHASYLANNPLSLRTDPEFLKLNPEFKYFPPNSAPDGLMVALGDTDAASQVWAWLRADPDASDFLAGKPDPWGAVINPAYKSLGLDSDTTTDSYPKADLSTFQQNANVPPPGFGTLDMRPYTLDMDEAGSRTLKADANVKTFWDQTKQPAAFVSTGAQVPGNRFELSITDTNAAALYGLRTASITNSLGQQVQPTTASLTAGINAMVNSDIPGVVEPDPERRADGAYPLTMLTYAVVNVCASPLSALADYRKLLTYAVGTGQVTGTEPGDLPNGYVPLSPTFVAQTTGVVADLETEIKTPACPSHIVTPTSSDTPDPIVDDSSGGAVSSSASGGRSAPIPTASPTPSAVPVTRPTPAVQTAATRYTIWAALFFAAPLLAIGPLLLRRRGA
jgi:ABC-type phosphate transport system substrate-binding protein